MTLLSNRGAQRGLLSLALLTALAPAVQADPCGMVPPLYEGPGPAITRIGVQQTYVFYKGGVESFVIRPGFSGKVDQFGMLIPFPAVPAIRKVDDEIFAHIRNAVAPPPVVVRWPYPKVRRRLQRGGAPGRDGKNLEFGRKEKGLRVVKQEAVGMYEVAVLEAGSPEVLARWMTDHGYRYPKGMDAVVADYVKASWCFVAVKARVGQKGGVEPRPGMRETKSALPKGAAFDGNVQAMGFRFKTPKLVVPMRLSAFNAGKLNNRVTILSEKPQRIDGIPTQLIKVQLTGQQLYDHLTQLRPLKLVGSKDWSKVPRAVIDSVRPQRDPGPYNGLAKSLFASDLEAVRTGRLALAHEEREKELLRIGERLGLRGEALDAMHREALAAERDEAVARSLAALKGMSLTVIEGDFPREVLARDNLHFSEYVAHNKGPVRYLQPDSTPGEVGPGQKKPTPKKKKAPSEPKDSRQGAVPSAPGRLGPGYGFGFLALFGLVGAFLGRPELLLSTLTPGGAL
jgi:uncharacterized protein DUF2330